MKTVLARRGFLGALAALPTVARASAEKAGLTSQITNQAYGGAEGIAAAIRALGEKEK